MSYSIDTLWVLLCAFLVFFMNTGFGCLESGLCRSKNAVNILAKNFVVFGLASLSFWACGFAIMFADGNLFFGMEGFFLSGADNSPIGGDQYAGVYSALSWATIPLAAKFFFQLAFAATAATIVSGCVAERIHYLSFMIFALVLTSVLYPVTGHWIWGGGWLQELGMWDFAGSTVVHSVGGWAGLAAILIMGPRIGKYRKQSKIKPIPGHSMPLVFLGGMILWLGWFGFNPGSTMAISGDAANLVSHIVVTTNIAAAAAAIISSTLTAYLKNGKPDFTMTVNGALAGLVSITAPCAFVSVTSAVIIGLIAGVVVVYAVAFFDTLKIDDPVGALSVHLVCGIWGTIAVGLFAQTAIPGGIDANGLLFGGGMTLLMNQLIGIVCVGAFTFISSFAILKVIDQFLGIRVTPEQETKGLDLSEMGAESYPHEPSIDIKTIVKESRLGAAEGQFEIKSPVPTIRQQSFNVEIDGIDSNEFLSIWRSYCKNSQEPAYQNVYGSFIMLVDNKLRFTGADVKECLRVLQEVAGQISDNVTLKLEENNEENNDYYQTRKAQRSA